MSLFCIFRDFNAKRSPRRAANASAIKPNYFIVYQGQHSLQVQAPEADDCPDRGGRKEISLFIPRFLKRLPSLAKIKASLTVEAAVAMTLFLFAVVSLLDLFFVIRVQIQVQTALEQTGNQLAALPEEASLVTAELLFREKLSVNHADTSQISGGQSGISLEKSTVMGDRPVIDLVAVYRLKLPFFPEGAAKLTIVQRSRKTAFGEANFLSEEAADYVYVTLKGEVYHESMYCTYIRPVTQTVEFTSIEERRNQNGGKYGPCSFCCTGELLTVVWITEWGDCYHQSEHCRGIWHDVRQILRSEAEEEGRRGCSKCARVKAEN